MLKSGTDIAPATGTTTFSLSCVFYLLEKTEDLVRSGPTVNNRHVTQNTRDPTVDLLVVDSTFEKLL